MIASLLRLRHGLTRPTGAMSRILTACLAVTLLVVAAAPPSIRAQGPDVKRQGPPAADRARNDGQIWGALYLATDDKPAAAGSGPEASEASQAYVERLAKVFPQEHFQILGEHTQHIFAEYESWVVPSKNVFLKIDSKGPTEDGKGVNLHLQLWHDKRVLVKTDAVLKGDPIFIGGPEWGEGRLIMVVALRYLSQ